MPEDARRLRIFPGSRRGRLPSRSVILNQQQQQQEQQSRQSCPNLPQTTTAAAPVDQDAPPLSPRVYQAVVTPPGLNLPRMHNYQPGEEIFDVEESSDHTRNRSHSHPLSAMLGGRRESSNSVMSSSTRQLHHHQNHQQQQHQTLLFNQPRKSWFPFFMERNTRLRRLVFWSAALGIFLFCFALVFILPQNLQPLGPAVLGSLLSFISALVIVVSYLLQPQNRRYPNELLVYVAICEFGLALLALVYVIVYRSTTDDEAQSNNISVASVCRPMSFASCSITVSIEMFLLCASVGWFGAAIVHLFVSISNPFANYNSQLKKYHVLIWSGSLLLSVVVPLVVFSTSFQDKYEMTGAELCRAVGLLFPTLPAYTSEEDRQQRIEQWKQLNMAFWGALFALVVVLVVAAQTILVIGWWRSNSGTVIALKARRRMMKRMTIYVHTLNVTWLVILVAYFTYRSNSSALARLSIEDPAASSSDTSSYSGNMQGINVLDAIVHFLLAAKGYFTCVVWVNVNGHCCSIGAIFCGGGAERDLNNENDLEFGSDSNHVTWSGSSVRSLDPMSIGADQSNHHVHRSRPSTSRSQNAYRYNHGRYGRSGTAAQDPLRGLSSSSWTTQNTETLQREIIYYTVCGITKAILNAAQSTDTANVFFQRLMVGAERDSAFSNNTMISNVQNIDMLNSPRAYCQPPVPPMDLSLKRSESTASTANDTSFGSIGNLLNGGHSIQQHRLSQSSNGGGTGSRFSLYPVSQVPFELFEQEIELQSNRSSTSSLGLSPLFAGIRRTFIGSQQQQQQAQPQTPSTKGIVDPKPKVFIDYAPNEFRMIRNAFGLSDEMYLASFRTTAKERVSAGSSGAFMFFSGDNSLIVKSMKEKECRKLVQMMPKYAAYIAQHPQSRIIRFFGCHRIRLYGRNFYFVVMSNVLHSVHHTATITEKYDLKGSWVDRSARLPTVGDVVTCADCNVNYQFGHADASTTFPFHIHQPDTILKDMDYKRTLQLAPRVAADLHAQLVLDCEFLTSMGIMDYSLLIGVHKCRLQEPWLHQHHSEYQRDDNECANCCLTGSNLEPISSTGGNGVDDNEVYFVGIIDILQEWNWEKQVEKVGKVLIGKSARGISAVAPDAYCQRFRTRLTQILRPEMMTKSVAMTGPSDDDDDEVYCLDEDANSVMEDSRATLAKCSDEEAWELEAYSFCNET